jgi:alanine dehydrogenase
MRNDASLVLLDKDVVESLLLPDDVLGAVHESFVLHSQREGRVLLVVREALDTGGIFGIKSGHVPTQNLPGVRPRVSGRAIEGSVESLIRPLSC